MQHIIYETSPRYSHAGLLAADGRLVGLRLDAHHRPYIEGCIVYARVRSVQHNLDCAFIDIGDVMDAVLPLSSVPDDVGKLAEGQAIVVRVTRGQWAEKGARVSARVVAEPEPGIKPPRIIKPALDCLGRIMLDAGENPVTVCVTRRDVYASLLERVGESHLVYLPDAPELEEHLAIFDETVDTLGDSTIKLAGGGSLKLEHTQALTAFDVDQGSGKNARSVNRQAALEIVRLCKLLDLGGSILVDFITPKSKTERNELKQLLEDTFAEKDSHRVAVLPMSPFGLVEINREQHGPRLDQLLAEPAYLAGRALLQMTRVEKPGAELELETNPATADELKHMFEASGLTLSRAVKIIENSELHQRFVLRQP